MTWDLEVGMTGTSKTVQKVMPQLQLDMQTWRSCSDAAMETWTCRRGVQTLRHEYADMDMQAWTLNNMTWDL